MVEELDNKPHKRRKPEKTKIMMAFHVYADDHKLFRQIAFQSQMAISELLRKSLFDFENIKFPVALLQSIMPQRGTTGVSTVTTTFNISPKDRERLVSISERHKIKLTDAIRAIMKKVIADNEVSIDGEVITKNEKKERLDIEVPSDVFGVMHAYSLREFTNLSEFIRLNFDKFTIEDYKRYAHRVKDAKENKALYRTSVSLYPKMNIEIEDMLAQLNEGLAKRAIKNKKSDIIGAFLYFAEERIEKTKKK